MIADGGSRMDLTFLHAAEREIVLEVLQRDKVLRSIEENRIRRMKLKLQELRRKGAKSATQQYGEHTCARCQRPLGRVWNCGAVCRGCSHRICSRCRVGASAALWRCTVCHAYREVKIHSGDWFVEQRVRKFPVTTDKYETAGEKLLRVHVLSHIAVVPPTPPPGLDRVFLSRSGDFKGAEPFSKSMENLLKSFAGPVPRETSSSQTDVREGLLTVHGGRRASDFLSNIQKSLSDTDISKFSKLSKGPSLPNLFKRSKDSDLDGSSTGAEEEALEYSGGKRGSSSSSTSTEFTPLEGASVCGELQLRLAYNSSTSSLDMTVGACRNLSSRGSKRNKCHPFVKLCVLPEKSAKMKTAVKKNTTDPVFNEVLKYQVERHLLFGKRLQVTVWHSGTLKRKVFLGQVLIPLDGCRFEDETPDRFDWYPLCPQSEYPDGGAVEQD